MSAASDQRQACPLEAYSPLMFDETERTSLHLVTFLSHVWS